MASRMSRKSIWITLIIAILALVAGAVGCNSSLLSEKAPDFTLSTLTGANVTLSELKGTPVVINFWATWCRYCIPELPYFEAVAQESEEEIKVIAINVGQTASTVRAFFRNYEPTMIVALDTNAAVFGSYSREDNTLGQIPFTVFVDSEGIVRYLQIGPFASEAALWNKLHEVLGITVP